MKIWKIALFLVHNQAKHIEFKTLSNHPILLYFFQEELEHYKKQQQ